jgi:hypothetical protein
MTNTAETFGAKTVEQSGNAVHQAYHEAKDTAREGVEIAKEAAVEGHDVLRRFIEDSPHTATVAFLAVGAVLGYWAGRQRSTW